MAKSAQKFIAKNRAPRVQIEYDVELYGAEKKVQLPFVMGVMSDLAGKSEVDQGSVSDRKFLEIDVDNFDDRMKSMAPRAAFTVPNTLTGEGNVAIDLTFTKMADFEPGAIAARVDTLRPLLEARQQLSNLMTYMDGKSGAEALIEKILHDPALLGALAAGSGARSADQDAALDALRASAVPETEAKDETGDALDALRAVQVAQPVSDDSSATLESLRSVEIPETEAPDTATAALDALRSAETPATPTDNDSARALDALRSTEMPEVPSTDDSSKALDALRSTQVPDAETPDNAGAALDALRATETADAPVTDDSAETLDALRQSELPDTPKADPSAAALASLPAADQTEPEEDDTADILAGIETVEAPTTEDAHTSALDTLEPALQADEAPEDTTDNVLAGIEAPQETSPGDLVGAALAGLEALPEAPEDITQAEDILASIEAPPEAAPVEDSSDVLAGLEAPEEVEEEDDLDALLSDIEAPEAAEAEDTAEDILAGLDAPAEAGAEDDLDALLSDIEAPEAAEAEDTAEDILAGLDAPAEDEAEDDLDALLAGIEAPDANEAETDSAIDDILAELEAEEVGSEDQDLDALLSDLTTETPQQAAEVDLDDLLADLGATDVGDAEEGNDDLDALLNDVVGETPEAEDGEDDIDALLANIEASAEDTPAEQDTDDLDAILAELDDDSPEPATAEDDLDALLAGLDDDGAEPETGGEDLDALLADLDAPGAEAPAAQIAPPAEPQAPADERPPADAAAPQSEPALAFGQLSADRPAPQRLARKRFRLAILGDFTGRAARGAMEVGDALAARKAIPLDPDTVEEVIEGFATTLILPIGKDGAGVEITLGGLDDLHPDELYENVELFSALKDLKGQLAHGGTADHAAKTLQAWGETHGQKVAPPKAVSGGNTIRPDLKLSDFQRLIGDSAGALTQASPLDDLLARVVGPHIRKLPDPDATAMAEAVDAALSSAMRLVLHHPDFQSIEAQWRAIDLIARSIETDDTLDVILYDVSADEIAADLTQSDDLADSGLVRLLTEEPLDEENGRGGYSALIGMYTFAETPPHAHLLGRIGRVAAHVDAPFISAITPQFLETKKEDRHNLVAKAWDDLRAMPEARHLGLASPRFLLRRPYGAKTEPIDEFDFEEFTQAEGLSGMLWANPVVLTAILLAKSFREHGAGMNLGQIMSLGGMPYHYVNDAYGDQVALPCTERNLTLDKVEVVMGRGFMPVISVKGRDEVRLGSFQSLGGGEIAGPWSETPPAPPSPPEPEPEPVQEPEPAAQAAPEAPPEPAQAASPAPAPEPEDDLDALLASFDLDADTDDQDDDDMDAELAALLADL